MIIMSFSRLRNTVWIVASAMLLILQCTHLMMMGTAQDNINVDLRGAVRDGNMCNVKKLISEGADPFDPRTIYLSNSFEIAASQCHVTILMCLIQYANSMDRDLRRTYFAETDILYGAIGCMKDTKSRCDTLQMLLPLFDLEKTIGLGSPMGSYAHSSPLHHSIIASRWTSGCDNLCASFAVMKQLIAAGADVNNDGSWRASASSYCQHITALHEAADNSDADGLHLVLELLRHGADVHLHQSCVHLSSSSNYELSALQIAIAHGDSPYIQKAITDALNGEFDYNDDYGHRLDCKHDESWPKYYELM